MIPNEFKSWFDGFTESFTDVPTKSQWARVKDRVAEIDGKSVTERVYVDRYINQYWPTYVRPPYWYQAPSWQALGGCYESQNNSVGASQLQQAGFNGVAAMNALGRAEASAIGGNLS